MLAASTILVTSVAHADLDAAAAWSSPETDETFSVAWGDWDGDLDLDLACGNVGPGFTGGPNRIYRNDGGGVMTLAWSSVETEDTFSVAWGDWDGDLDLDLAAGNRLAPVRVYRNDGGGVMTPAWSSPEVTYSYSVAWGDWDGDLDLDLAVGNSLEANRIYRNDGGGVMTLAWSSAETESTHSVAWGDWDGDLDLDLAVGNASFLLPEPNRIYRNDGGGVMTPAWASVETDRTMSVAWGDYDADMDLDLAAGNFADPNRVYRNDGGGVMTLVWSSSEGDATSSVAWDDWDGDGDDDLAVGNRMNQNNRVYRSEAGDLSLAWCSRETDDTWSVAWGDWDGDLDADLAEGNASVQANRIHPNGSTPCLVATLTPRTVLEGVKDGTGGARFRWAPDSFAIEYHLNTVPSKRDLVPPGPYRPPASGGMGTGQCESIAPLTTCVDPDAISDAVALLFYQVLSACGPCGGLEGPAF